MALQAEVRKRFEDCQVAGLKDGGRGHKLGSAGSLWKLEKAKKKKTKQILEPLEIYDTFILF